MGAPLLGCWVYCSLLLDLHGLSCLVCGRNKVFLSWFWVFFFLRGVFFVSVHVAWLARPSVDGGLYIDWWAFWRFIRKEGGWGLWIVDMVMEGGWSGRWGC